MSDSGRGNQEQNESPEARAETRAAEAKVAWGIKHVYAISQRYARYDAQGIATVTLEPETFNEEIDTPFGRSRLGDLFPNGLANGVTVHLFEKGYLPHPAAFYMIQQKVRSLCNAAKLPPVNIEDADLVSQRLEAKVREELEKQTRNIKADDKKYPTMEDKVTAFHQVVDAIMQNASANAVKLLHEEYLLTASKTPLDFANFSQQLLDTSAHHRTDTHDVLTFNLDTQHFSYEEAAKVTAHDRLIGNGCANLSITIEGNYLNVDKNIHLIKATVNNTLVKHASPVAIQELGKSKVKEIDLIADTSRNMLEIVSTMARLRLHGRRPEDRNKPMKIDWVYQILTTNAGNSENQAPTYGYVTRAARLLNHSNLQLGDTPVSLDVSVINAGINKLGGVGSVSKTFKLFGKLVQKSDTQRRENRHAYRQLTNAVSTITVDPTQIIADATEQSKLAGSIDRLKNMLIAAPSVQAENAAEAEAEANAAKVYRKIAEINQRIANNSQKFMNASSEYHRMLTRRDNLIESLNSLNEGKPSDTKRNMAIELKQDIHDVEALLQARTPVIMKELVACDAQATANYDEMVAQSNLAENHQRSRWQKSHPHVESEVKQLQAFLQQNNEEIQARLDNPKTAEATTNQLQSIYALIYKAYADKLYLGSGENKYAEVYRTPEKAAIFNAYLSLFQYLTPGMTSSTGCKSANDRTMVMRLLIAGLADLPGAPLALHENPLAESVFIKKLNDMVMTISALFATEADTQGATPKVDEGKFPYLAGMMNLKKISHFGEYAPHKMTIQQPIRSAAERARAGTQQDQLIHHSGMFSSAAAAARKPSTSASSSASTSEDEYGDEQKETSKTRITYKSPGSSEGNV
jgi:hypothetical protein